MIVKLLTEHHLEFLSLKGGCRGSSESIHVKMPHCWKSHALAQIQITPYAHMSSAFNLNGCFVCLQRNDVSKALCKRVITQGSGHGKLVQLVFVNRHMSNLTKFYCSVSFVRQYTSRWSIPTRTGFATSAEYSQIGLKKNGGLLTGQKVRDRLLLISS